MLSPAPAGHIAVVLFLDHTPVADHMPVAGHMSVGRRAMEVVIAPATQNWQDLPSPRDSESLKIGGC